MKQDTIQQEIMILTGTTFSQRPLCGSDGKLEGKNLTESEKLEKAVWDGLLDELLPEIIVDKKVHIWQIWDTEYALQVELSKYPLGEKHSSINPYYFLISANYN